MINADKNFSGLGISPDILGVLEKLNFKIPTPIQEQSIPIAIEGKDVMGIAQTGTGKTLAFGIPMLQRVIIEKKLGLIVVPTRELALQVSEALDAVGSPLGIKTATIIGGEPMPRQLRALSRHPHIVIGTPGRIIDHIERRTLDLRNVGILILDEADRMLDMGFEPQLKQILSVIPHERQTMLFSATMPDEIMSIARTHMKLPIRIEIARAGSTAKDVTHELFIVAQEDKSRLLEKLLQEYRGSVLVFSRTKHSAKRIAAIVRFIGHTGAEIHSNRSLAQRRDALEGFKQGRYRVLVATDIAARGIDVTNIELVINYDLPENAEDYVHRIGRTGRAGLSGHAISFARPNQSGDVRAIERLIRSSLPVSKLPELPRVLPASRTGIPPEREERRGRSGGFSRSGGGRSHSSSSSRRPFSSHSPSSRPSSPASSSSEAGKTKPRFRNRGPRPMRSFGR
ncbi:MAG: DEAD/DEAH box helicase [Candidatus Paceibacterota bacterium]|jgi:ATP-dependent RNA helicase RhlE